MDGNLVAEGSQQLTVSNSAVSLTIPTSGMRPGHALIQVLGAPIRWLAGGTAPTASLGVRMEVGDILDWTDPAGYYRHLIENAQFIRAEASDATLEIVYFT